MQKPTSTAWRELAKQYRRQATNLHAMIELKEQQGGMAESAHWPQAKATALQAAARWEQLAKDAEIEATKIEAAA